MTSQLNEIFCVLDLLMFDRLLFVNYFSKTTNHIPHEVYHSKPYPSYFKIFFLSLSRSEFCHTRSWSSSKAFTFCPRCSIPKHGVLFYITWFCWARWVFPLPTGLNKEFWNIKRLCFLTGSKWLTSRMAGRGDNHYHTHTSIMPFFNLQIGIAGLGNNFASTLCHEAGIENVIDI